MVEAPGGHGRHHQAVSDLEALGRAAADEDEIAVRHHGLVLVFLADDPEGPDLPEIAFSRGGDEEGHEDEVLEGVGVLVQGAPRRRLEVGLQVGHLARGEVLVLGLGHRAAPALHQDRIARVDPVRILDPLVQLPDLGPGEGIAQVLGAQVPERVALGHDVDLLALGRARHPGVVPARRVRHHRDRLGLGGRRGLGLGPQTEGDQRGNRKCTKFIPLPHEVLPG